MKRTRFIFLIKLLGPGVAALLVGVIYFVLFGRQSLPVLYAPEAGPMENGLMYCTLFLGLVAVVWSIYFPRKKLDSSMLTKLLLAMCSVCWALGLMLGPALEMTGITIELLLFIALVWIYFSLYGQQQIKPGLNIPFLYFFFRIGGLVLGLGVWIVYFFYFMLDRGTLESLPSIGYSFVSFLLTVMLAPLVISGLLYIVKSIDEYVEDDEGQYESMLDSIGD